MDGGAGMVAPALRRYSGAITRPERWPTWLPRRGDVLVCTPPKCGTTWTQTILSMLVHGGPELPGTVPVLSPWIDADLGVPPEEVQRALDAQPGRRVVKTHTPADGFPLWNGVTVIAAYRHPLDVFFSLRKHVANRVTASPDSPMLLPLSESFRAFIEGDADLEDFDRDTLATIAVHYDKTARSGRVPAAHVFHYSDMLRDGRRAVAELARTAGIAADAALIDRIAEATSFEIMKANARNYVPVAGTGFWKSDAGFFHSGTSRKWHGELSEADLHLYRERLKKLVPDAIARDWLENGTG